MRKLDRPITAAVPSTLLPRTIQGRVSNLEIATIGFALNNSSKKFAVGLEMEMGGSISPLSLISRLVLVRHCEMLLLFDNCARLPNSLVA
jgi:hypothetical protein